MINYVLSGKFMIIIPIAGLIKKILLHKMSHNPETNSHIKNKIKVELDFSNCAKKSNVM